MRVPPKATALLAGAVFTLTSVFGVAVAAGAAKRKHKRTGGNRHVVHVIEHAVTDTEVPSGGRDATGNVLTFHNPVYDAADKNQVGTDLGFCIRISPADGSWSCEWTTFLPKGQINVAGPFFDTSNSVLAITGGTGAYRKARGEMNLNSLMGGKEYDFIFHLN